MGNVFHRVCVFRLSLLTKFRKMMRKPWGKDAETQLFGFPCGLMCSGTAVGLCAVGPLQYSPGPDVSFMLYSRICSRIVDNSLPSWNFIPHLHRHMWSLRCSKFVPFQ